MSGKTIGKSLGYGFAGNFARMPDMVIRSFCLADSSPEVKFGEAVFLADGAVTGYKDGLTAAQFLGVAVSEIKSAFTYDSMEGAYRSGQAIPVMSRGAVSALCPVGEPSVGKAVYLRITKNDAVPAGVVGGFEAAADGGNTVELTNAVWTTGKDTNGVAELLLKTINLV